MKVKEYLSQAQRLKRRMKIEREKVEELMSAIEYKSPSFEAIGSFSGGNNDKIPDAIAEAIEYKAKYDTIRAEYARKYCEIEQTINSIEDLEEREVLERRYLLGERWDSKYNAETNEYIIGIADKLGCSVRQAQRKHGTALTKIKIPENSQIAKKSK